MLRSSPEIAIPAEPARSTRAQDPIGVEDRWRCPVDTDSAASKAADTVVITRWKCDGADAAEHSTQAGSDHHTIAINLKSTQLTFDYAGRPIHSGCAVPGATQVTSPGTPVRAVFHAPCDVLHVYVSQPLLAECYGGAFGAGHSGDIVISNPNLIQDPAIERLGLALANAGETCGAFGRVYADSLGLAIVSRLLAREFGSIDRAATRRRASLPAWRVKRAIDYIDAHLSEQLSLSDIAQSAGLSRMHSAAQFRAATGMRPHEFLLRRRVERAQTLLMRPRLTSLDVALSTGFRSQAHFTTVFKRLVGETPARWRADARGNS